MRRTKAERELLERRRVGRALRNAVYDLTFADEVEDDGKRQAIKCAVALASEITLMTRELARIARGDHTRDGGEGGAK